MKWIIIKLLTACLRGVGGSLIVLRNLCPSSLQTNLDRDQSSEGVPDPNRPAVPVVQPRL